MPVHPAPATDTAPSVAAAAPPAATKATLVAVAAMAVIQAVEVPVPLVTVPLNCPWEKRIGCRAGTIW